MILAAYGIRKAYKKQQAKKAQKLQLEQENSDPAGATHCNETQSACSSASPHLRSSSIGSDYVSNHNIPSSTNRLDSASRSSGNSYSPSVYSQSSIKDPLEEMRQYQAYIQRQSHDFGNDVDPPTYEIVIGQDLNASQPPWHSPFRLPARTESPHQLRESRHVPQGTDRLVELDSSSESSRSTSHQVPRRLFHARSPITSESQLVSPATELGADYPDTVVSPILDDELQASLDELVAEAPPPLRIRKSQDREVFELPTNKIASDPSLKADDAEQYATNADRSYLKRARSESESEIESEDNEEVIVRFDVVDRTKKPFPKRV